MLKYFGMNLLSIDVFVGWMNLSVVECMIVFGVLFCMISVFYVVFLDVELGSEVCVCVVNLVFLVVLFVVRVELIVVVLVVLIVVRLISSC